MACDLTDTAQQLLDAYNALCDSCCGGSASAKALVDQDAECVYPLIRGIHIAVATLLAPGGYGCDAMTASVPSPEMPGECLNGGYLADLLAHIQSITCEGTGTICDVDLSAAGGDEGYDETFTSGNGGFTITIDYETYYQKDQIILSAVGGATLFDSGCVGTGGTVTVDVDIPDGVTEVRVQVIPNCEGGSGTAWTLSISCA